MYVHPVVAAAVNVCALHLCLDYNVSYRIDCEYLKMQEEITSMAVQTKQKKR